MFLSSLLILGGVQAVLAGTQLYGLNVAGFEFGCEIDGTCPLDTIQPPLLSLGFGDGAGQMAHFVKDDAMNVFRLPVSWQYLTNNVIGPLDDKNFGNYDLLMQACLKTGAYCVIDVHNFARWNGGIIGQGGPTDAQFADLWAQLASKYASNAFVIFELMNEPHDIDLTAWTASCQAAVTAIRKAEKVSHTILLPGENFSSAGTFLAGWGAALATVTNPDGSTTNLLLDLHKYLDVDNSGDHPDCVMDNVDTFTAIAAWLRTNKRQAILSETGAGVTSDSCFTDFCAQNTAINANSDVYLGYIAWTAGSVTGDYILDLAPTLTGTTWVDAKMAVQCVIAPWVSATGSPPAPAWGLTLNAAGIAIPSGLSSSKTVSSSSSTAVSTSSSVTGSSTIMTSTTKSGAGSSTASGTASGTAPSATQKKTSNSAKGAQVASGLIACSLILAVILM